MDALIWGALAALAAVGMLQIAVLRSVSGIASKLAKTESKAEHADAVAAGAMGKAEVLGTEFHNHRVETASKVARIEAEAMAASRALVDAEGRMVKAFDDLRQDVSTRLDNIVDRLDRMADNPPRQK